MEERDDEISLRDIVLWVRAQYKTLKSKWYLILIASLLGGGIGFCNAYFSPVEYTAKLTFAFSEGQTTRSNLSGIASQFGFNLGDGGEGAFQGENLLELMKSRTLVENTLMQEVVVGGKEDLLVNHIITHEFNHSETNEDRRHDVWFLDTNRFFLGDSFLGVYHNHLLENNRLSISMKDDELSFVDVSFTSQNDTISKLFVEGLVDQATQLYKNIKLRRSEEAIAVLNQKIDSVEVEMAKSMVGGAQELDRGTLYIRNTPKVSQVRNQLQTQILGTMHAELVKNAELQKTIMAQQTPLFELVDLPKFPIEKKKASELKGLFFGGILAGFLISLWIVGRGAFREMMGDN